MSLSSRRRRSRGAPRNRSVASTLSLRGCPRLEFALHALFGRLHGRRVCRVHALLAPVARVEEFVVCTPRPSVARTSSRSASTTAPQSYLCSRPPRSVPRIVGARSLRSGFPEFVHRSSVSRNSAAESASSAHAARFPVGRAGRFSRHPVSRCPRSAITKQSPARRSGAVATRSPQGCPSDPHAADGDQTARF